MLSIIIGAIFIVGGLSGRLVMRGTNSSTALVVIGAGLVVWGVLQMARARTR